MAQAATHHGIATARLSLSRYEPAIEYFELARRFSERAGRHEAQAAALGNLGIILSNVYFELGRLRLAEEHCTLAPAIHREQAWCAGDPPRHGGTGDGGRGTGQRRPHAVSRR